MKHTKRTLALLLAMALLLTLCACGARTAPEPTAAPTPTPDPGPTITKRETDFYLTELDDVRRYNLYFIDGSDVPYVSLEDWAELMPYLVKTYIHKDEHCGYSLDYTRQGDTAVLTREDGYMMRADCAAGTIYFLDYDAFLRFDPDRLIIDVLSADDPREGEDGKYYRRTEGSYERYGDEVTLDLAAYGIGLYADENGCYAPLQTLSDFLLAITYMNVFYNGEAVYFVSYGGLGDDDEPTDLGERFYSVEQRELSEATADFSYKELCLVLDKLYGLKDVHGIESFDKLLDAAGLSDVLKSTDPVRKDKALYYLINFDLDDLHSSFNHASPFAPASLGGEMRETLGRGNSRRMLMGHLLDYTAARDEMRPDGVPGYEEFGNTAYITFDNFDGPDEDTDYYQSPPTGEETDVIGILAYAYAQILREDSPIENVVLDLSCNTGGDADMAVYTVCAFLGEGSVSAADTFSRALGTSNYVADLNLDGKFDELDLGLTELNRYCLISPVSFSCGNLVPNVFQNSNSVTLLGRTSGGGSCCVLPLSTAYGTSFNISGPVRLAFLKNGSFYDIDQGAVPEFVLSKSESFYDRAALSAYINQLP